MQEVFACIHEVMMTEAKSEAHVLNIIHIYHYFFIFSQRNLTLRENECRFKTYMSLLYTNTRRKSLYDKIDAELIEIFYRIKLKRQIHRIHVPPSNIKHIHV